MNKDDIKTQLVNSLSASIGNGLFQAYFDNNQSTIDSIIPRSVDIKPTIDSIIPRYIQKHTQELSGFGNYKFIQKYGQNVYRPDAVEKLKLSSLYFSNIPGSSDNKKIISNYLTEIPALAEGGIVSSPTIAMIGERGPEAIIPLNRSAGGLLPAKYNNIGTAPPDRSSSEPSSVEPPRSRSNTMRTAGVDTPTYSMPASVNNDNMVSYGTDSIGILRDNFLNYSPPRRSFLS